MIDNSALSQAMRNARAKLDQLEQQAQKNAPVIMGQMPKSFSLSVQNDNYQKGNKSSPLDLKHNFIPLSTDLSVFQKHLNLNGLTYAADREVATELKDEKFNPVQLQTGLYIYPNDHGISDVDKLSKNHLHVIFTRDKEENRHWRLTAVLPKENNSRTGVDPTLNRLTGTPDEWVAKSAKYEQQCTSTLVKEFAEVVLCFKAEMKSLKMDEKLDTFERETEVALRNSYDSLPPNDPPVAGKS